MQLNVCFIDSSYFYLLNNAFLAFLKTNVCFGTGSRQYPVQNSTAGSKSMQPFCDECGQPTKKKI